MSQRNTRRKSKIVAASLIFTLGEACSSANSGTAGDSPSAGGANAAGGALPSGGMTTMSGGAPASGGSQPLGGWNGAGGSLALGGSLAMGGSSQTATGGQFTGGTTGTSTRSPSGGNPPSGGQASTGGQVTTGGQGNTGGRSNTSGTVATGGQASTGGQVTTGGQTANGGRSSTGGTLASGGASAVACPSTVLAPGNTTRTIQVGGRSRTYVLHAPSAYTGKTAVPLLVDFHPHGSTGPAWQTGSPYPSVVDVEGVISAYPSAVGDWNVGPCCSDGVDDVGFARALVKEVEGVACIDVKRVYAAGFSMGGGMTNYVACGAADVFAAFAPAAFDLLQENVAECKPVRPITVVSFRGTADTMVPYAGGLSNLVKPITFLGAVNTMKKWAELSGCTGAAADIGNNCQGYATSQCQSGVEVVLCTKQGGGHEAANATLTWPVLKRHTLP